MQEIFANANTSIKQPRILRKLVEEIDKLDWYSARTEGLGDLYEGLLEKNANEKKSGAGQYFTPRPLIDCMVALIKPRPGEVMQDPAAGTGGFLIAADRHIRALTDDYFKLTEAQQHFQRTRAYVGVELVQDAHRLLLMNAVPPRPLGPPRARRHALAPGRELAQGRRHPDQPALRHQEGRRAPDPGRLHLPDLQQAARLPPAHLPRAQARRARRGRAARQRALRGEHRHPHPHRPDGQVRPAHDPAAADRHLLRPGRQDQRAVLHPRRDRQGQHQGGLDLRPARQHAQLRQAHAVHPRALRRVRGGVRG